MKTQTTIAVVAIAAIIIALLTLRSCNVIHGQSGTSTTQLVGVDTVVIPKAPETKHSTASRVVRVGVKGDTAQIPIDVIAKDTSCKPFIATSDTMTMYDKARIATSFYYPSCKFSTYYHPAPDTLLIRSYLQQQKTGWGIAVGGGYGAFQVDGNVKTGPVINIGIYKTLWEF